jgi:hypothetical protein
MKTLFKILALLLVSCAGYAQVVSPVAIVPSIAKLKTFNGPASVVYVTDSSRFYATCSPCVADEITIFAGAGGKKWKASVGGNGVDTTSLSNRINTKISAGDTAAMLAPYADRYVLRSTVDSLRLLNVDIYHFYSYLNGRQTGDYYYDPSDVSTADDGYMTLVATGGKRLKRVVADRVSPEDFGAQPYPADATLAFDRMFRWIEGAQNRSYVVYFRNRHYLVDTTVNFIETLTGEGEFKRIHVDGYGVTISRTTTGPIFRRLPVDQTEALTFISAYNLTMSGLKFEGNQTAGQVALDLSALYTPVFQDLTIRNFDTAFVGKFHLNPRFLNNHMQSNKTIAFQGSSGVNYWTGASLSNSAFNMPLFSGNRIYNADNSLYGIHLLASDGFIVRDHISEGFNPYRDINIDHQNASVVNQGKIENVWFESDESGGENDNNTCIYIRHQGTIEINGIQNDYPDTIISLYPSNPSLHIIAKNWAYINSSGVVFGGNGVLNNSVYIDVKDMPKNYNDLFFNTAKWSGGVIGAVVGMGGFNSDGTFGLRVVNAQLTLSSPSAGVGFINFNTLVANMLGGQYWRWYSGTDLVNYNMLEISQQSNSSILDIKNAGSNGTGALFMRLNGGNRLAYDNNNVILYRTTIPGTTNTYALGTTSARWSKAWTTDLDASGVVTLGGVAGGSGTTDSALVRDPSTGIASMKRLSSLDGSPWSGGWTATATSASTSLTMTTGTQVYVFNGSSTATWTLPALGTTRGISIKNNGTADLIVQRAGSDQLWTSSAVNSITLTPGQSAATYGVGGYWSVFFTGGATAGIQPSDTASMLAPYARISNVAALALANTFANTNTFPKVIADSVDAATVIAGRAELDTLKIGGATGVGYVLVDPTGNGIGAWTAPTPVVVPDDDYGDIGVTGAGSVWSITEAAKVGLRSETATLTNKTIDGALNTLVNIPSTAIDFGDLLEEDPDLTTIAALSPSNDDIIQRKSGAWTNRTVAQYKSDLALNNVPNVDATNASNITTGTLADGRLSSNIPLKNAVNTFTAGQILGPTSTLSSGSFENLVLGGTINQTGTASSTSLLINPYLQAEASGGTYLIDAGTRSAAYPSGAYSRKFSVWGNGLVNSNLGYTMVDQASAPTIPATSVATYAKTLRGSQHLAAVNNNYNYIVQRAFASGNTGVILFQGATGSSSLGLRAGSASGTATTVSPSPTGTVYTRSNRSSYVSASSAGSSAGIPGDLRRWWLSSTSGVGGFKFTLVFGDGTAVANQRSLAGMWGSDGVPGNVEPSSLTNFVGMAYDAGGTTWKIMHNDGSGTCTIIDLGANFPVAANEGYILTLDIAPGVTNSLTYYVERMGTAFTATGTITTNLPAENQRLGWLRWINNGSTASSATAEISAVAYDQIQTSLNGY